jgi:hypothetical protein
MTNKSTTFIEEAIGNVLNEQGGRYAREVPTVTGAKNLYPRQPDTSSWSHGQLVPPEGPLGYSVSAPIVTGEAHELDGVAPSSSQSEGGAPPQGSDPGLLPSPVEPAPGETISEDDIPDGWPRRSDGTPMSSPPHGLRRRA